MWKKHTNAIIPKVLVKIILNQAFEIKYSYMLKSLSHFGNFTNISNLSHFSNFSNISSLSNICDLSHF